MWSADETGDRINGNEADRTCSGVGTDVPAGNSDIKDCRCGWRRSNHCPLPPADRCTGRTRHSGRTQSSSARRGPAAEPGRSTEPCRPCSLPSCPWPATLQHGKSARERALESWLANRRRQAAEGTLSPAYREGLAVIPDWDKTSRSKADDEARWQQRLEELLRIRAAGGDWPRHQKTDDLNERILGVWLHGQRIEYRAGRLDPAREKKLNEILPGWREGRGHRGGRRASR